MVKSDILNLLRKGNGVKTMNSNLVFSVLVTWTVILA